MGRKKAAYAADEYIYKGAGQGDKVPTLYGSPFPQPHPGVVLPRFKDWGEILLRSQENVPGDFPYTGGVFPFKRKGEDPTRMFAGEGGRSAPINVSTTFRKICLPPVCPQPSTL